jgi:uncharacterized phage protein (TIGR01671 family)
MKFPFSEGEFHGLLCLIKNTYYKGVKVFKDCKCRIYLDKFKKVYSISSMYWEKGHLIAIDYEDPSREGTIKKVQLLEKDILMNFIGRYDKNNNELWEGDLVKFDRYNHGNHIIGVITFNRYTSAFIVEQLTNNKDFINTQKELDEEFKQKQESFINCFKQASYYNFNDPTNWINVVFYDYMGATFAYGELEKVGNLYENPELLQLKD